MAKVCRECGKKITGSVAEHYETNHFRMFVANKAAIERCPGAFAVSEDNAAQIKVIKTHISNRNALSRPAVQQNTTASQPSVVQDRKYLARRKQIKLVLEEYPETQTYRNQARGFTCDLCQKGYSSGKVIFQDPANIHLCYTCYNSIKAEIPPKPRKRRILHAGIPGLGKRH
jgi:hypothetical protein